MALPKKLVKNISLTPKKILTERREELLQQIQQDGTYLPKGIYHADLDRGMLDFVKDDLGISVNGKKVNPIDVIITTQNWAQFTQTWNFQDLDKNVSVPFIATVRKPETPYGTNQGTTFKIPGNPTFQYALIPTFDGARNGFDVYKIPQPTPVDITYQIKIFTNRMRELNSFNQKILNTFGSKQAYKQIKGRFIPILLDGISDESVTELQKRKYYIQTYTMKMLGVLLDEEQFEVTPAVSRVLTMVDNGVKIKQRKAKAPIPNENTIKGLYNFVDSNTILNDVIDLNSDYFLINTQNVNSFNVFIDNYYIGENVEYFQVNSKSLLRIDITKNNINEDSKILFDIKLV
jgi:hypothetical protein